MILTSVYQGYVLGMTIVAGMMTGLFFDIYRVLRGIKAPNRIVTFIEDFLFWILSGLLIYIFLHINGVGFVSLYAYMAIILGFIIYSIFISKRFVGVLSGLIKKLIIIIRLGLNYLIYPFQLILTRKKKI